MNEVTILLTGGPLDGHQKKISESAADVKIIHFWVDENSDKKESVVYAFSESKNQWVWVNLDLVPETLPTTGLIVWYYPSANYQKLAKVPADKPLPAMVIEADKAAAVVIRVFTPTGMDFTTGGVSYNKKGGANTWQWPATVKQIRALADVLK